MTIVLFVTYVLLCCVILAEGLVKTHRVYQFPFLAAAVCLGFIAVPLSGQLRDGQFPPDAVARYILVSILSIAAIWLGDAVYRKSPREVRYTQSAGYNMTKWLWAAFILSFVGMSAYLQNRSLFEDGFRMDTGPAVAVGFFVVLLRYGFIMAFICFMRTKSLLALGLVLVCSLYYFDRIVLFGRRQTLLEVLFVIAGTYWFTHRAIIPRVTLIAAVAFLSLFNFSTGLYRSVVVSTTGERDWSQLLRMDWLSGVRSVHDQGSSEVTAGVHYMAAVADSGAFDYGTIHWNLLVKNYVPAQIVGEAYKNALMASVPDIADIAASQFNYTKNNGSTVTGMVDCFASFWYFGVMKFFAIAYIMQFLYQRSLSNAVAFQCVYLFMMTMALHSITHHTGWFISPWIHLAVFWMPFLLYARLPGKKICLRPRLLVVEN